MIKDNDAEVLLERIEEVLASRPQANRGEPAPLDLVQAAAVAQMTRQGIHLAIQQGRLPCVRVGRRIYVRPEDLRVFLAGRGDAQ